MRAWRRLGVFFSSLPWPQHMMGRGCRSSGPAAAARAACAVPGQTRLGGEARDELVGVGVGGAAHVLVDLWWCGVWWEGGRKGGRGWKGRWLRQPRLFGHARAHGHRPPPPQRTPNHPAPLPRQAESRGARKEGGGRTKGTHRRAVADRVVAGPLLGDDVVHLAPGKHAYGSTGGRHAALNACMHE